LPEPSSPHKPRIFLCHASEDKPKVQALYHQLKKAGYHPWLDEYDLLPGQDWRQEIEKLITDPYNLVVVCLSNNSITKRGVVQQEITWALDVLDQMPEETIYLIPARLEPCQPPRRLSRLHWVDLFEPDGFENLKRTLDLELSKRQLPFEPELVLIPAGEFLMGSDPSVDKDASEDEQPQHTLYLPDYYMAKTPVTNAQYAAFLQATNHKMPYGWVNRQPREGREENPVIIEPWHDAVAYCNWLSEATGRVYRLPTEAEWEKAARGPDGRIFPWGNQWNEKRCNTKEGSKYNTGFLGGSDTTPVGSYSDGASSYGLLDMAGNVWEWTLSLWGKDWKTTDFKYPYNAKDGRENLEVRDKVYRVLRGGSCNFNLNFARCACRYRDVPHMRVSYFGFRPVAPISPPSTH
jgi:formylglycine-generating enzyme required for sulfatase activity